MNSSRTKRTRTPFLVNEICKRPQYQVQNPISSHLFRGQHILIAHQAVIRVLIEKQEVQADFLSRGRTDHTIVMNSVPRPRCIRPSATNYVQDSPEKGTVLNSAAAGSSLLAYFAWRING